MARQRCCGKIVLWPRNSPKHILHQIDNEANRIGVPRTSILKLWIVEKLRELKAAYLLVC